MSVQIRYEDAEYHLSAGPPHASEIKRDTVESALLAVVRLRAWGCHTTDITDALDATGHEWRQEYNANVLENRAVVARNHREMEQYADRLGIHANEDNDWFDKNIEFWRIEDGTRLVVLEISELGHQVVQWVRHGRNEIAEGVFSEMEEAMLDGLVESTTARDMSLELLDTLQAALLDLRNEDADGAIAVEAAIRRMMGDETELLWVPMWSETLTFLRRREGF